MNEKIAVNNLNLYYGNMKVLNNIDVSFEENSITALIGPSGCGKTSFLRTLNRLNDMVSNVKVEGNIMLDGEDIYEKMDPTILRKKVGMVFQKPNPFQ